MTATLTLPLVAWGSPADINAFTSVNTPTISSGVADPFGGTGAYTVNDNDGAATEYKYTEVTFPVDGTHQLVTYATFGSATTSHVTLYDATAATFRAVLQFAWSGGVPTCTISNGSGTVHGTISVGAGWYCVLWGADGIVSANTNRLHLYGATTTASSIGATTYYLRNTVLLSYVDGATTWPEPREGSQWAVAPSGTEDAWIVGTDWHLAGDVRHIPDTPTDWPETVSGWYGGNEATGVNCGVAAMLSAGRDKQALLWAKDRSDASSYVSGYLVEPMRGRPELEGNWRRRFPIELRSASTFTGY